MPRIDNLSSYAAAVLLVALVITAWLQYRWLDALRHEEEARRRVAVRVAASNYQERVERDVEAWLRDWPLDGAGPLPPDLIAARFEFDGGSWRVRTGDGGGPRPASAAEVQQWLGRPLLNRIEAMAGSTSSLWLAPPALIACDDWCRVGVVDNQALAERLGQAARAVFTEFENELAVGVVRTDGSGDRVGSFYLSEPDSGRFEVTDIDVPLLTGTDVLGPVGTQWRLWVNHGGGSLEAAVARSHLRNLLLSLAALALLGLAVMLVVAQARRARRLAEREMFFAASVSHELRTPLSVIGSAADNLADGTVKGADNVRRYGEVIRAETRRLRGMIENVLNFSRSAAADNLRSEPLQIQALIRSALEACTDRLDGISVETETGGDIPEIYGDPRALQAVMENLIFNAAKYGAGDERWLRIAVAPVRVPPRGRALRISFSNPIRGRLDAHPERLFEPFYRGRNAIRAGIVGTGVGLAVARRIARQHGGGLSVDTSVPDVVTFNLYLPMRKQPE